MDITKMHPASGRMIREDGTMINIADVLAGAAQSVGSAPINSYQPSSGRMIREDGSIVNIADLIAEGMIGGGASEGTGCSSRVSQTDHGTADTTFTLPPNQYHTWGEVSALTITLGEETPGVVNEYHFSFDSGTTATTLSLPEAIQTDIVVEPNTHYECSIIDNYMTFRDWPAEVSA